jgi:hypothetical protein
MGVHGNRNNPGEKTVYTERKIQQILRLHFMSPNSMKYRVENLWVYDWESDSLSFTKSGYVYECEIKISRADFFNDKKKERKHQILEGTYSLKKYEKNYPKRPNYFYYVVPEDLIKPEEIPPYAGLIYITETYPYVKIEVPAPKIHAVKVDEEALKLKEKFYYNYITWKEKAEEEYQTTIDNLRGQLKESRYDEDGKHHKYNLAEAEEKIAKLEKLNEYESLMSDKYKKLFFQSAAMCNDLEVFLLEKGVTREELKERKRKFRADYGIDE